MYTNTTYKFYLDGEGKYIGATPELDTEFIYGTYADYTQETSFSAFKYFMTGVNLDGEVVTKEFNSLDGNFMRNVPTGLEATDTFYHSFQTATTGTTIGHKTATDGDYEGFMLTSNGNLLSTWTGGPYKLAGSAADINIKINSGSVSTGAVLLSGTIGTVDVNEENPLYLSNQTKFIVVSGYGTDSVKAEVFTGLSEFKGSSSEVEIKRDQSTSTPYGAGTDDIFYTVSTGNYANVEGRRAREVNTIILNNASVVRKGGGGFYFVPSASPKLVDTYNANLQMYTVYQGDQAKDVWLDVSGAP